MAHPLGAVVAVVEAELTTPQRPTAECKGAEVMAEVDKAERLAEVAKVERQAEVAKVERLAEVAKVERLAEVAKVERLAEVAKVERLAEVDKVERLAEVVQAVVVVAKIRNCLKCLIPLSVMAMVNLIGEVLNQMAILVVFGLRQPLVQVELVLKI